MRVRGGSGAAAGPVPPPAGLRPMQPTAARELPADQASWAFEPKWDGYRALGHVVAGGFVPDPGGQVRSLLVGLPDPRNQGRLRFAGRVDHGLVPAARRRVGDLLASLATGQSPFAEPTAALLGGRWSRPGPGDPAPVLVRPELAVEVTFLGWEGGRLRHPAYSGLAAAGR
jgi:ATP-dependent DNA ligase